MEIPSYANYTIKACLGRRMHQWTEGSKSPDIKYVTAGLKFHVNEVSFGVCYDKVVLRVDLPFSAVTFILFHIHEKVKLKQGVTRFVFSINLALLKPWLIQISIQSALRKDAIQNSIFKKTKCTLNNIT